jgi:hypothetical protein
MTESTQEIIDELRRLRDESQREHDSAMAYGFRSQKKGEVLAYTKTLKLMGAI